MTEYFTGNYLLTDRIVEFGGGSSPMVDFSIDEKEYMNEKGLPTTKLVMDFTKEFYLPDEQFDVIICRHLVDGLPKDKISLFLRECLRVLRHGGKLSMLSRRYSLDHMLQSLREAGYWSVVELNKKSSGTIHLEAFRPVKVVSLFQKTINGCDIQLPNPNRDVFTSLLATEPEKAVGHEIDMMQRLVQPGWTVIDVGAHIGVLTTQLSKLVGPTGRVLAFEASPVNFPVLKINLEVNGCSANSQAYSCAVMDKIGQLQLYVSRQNSGDNRLWRTIKEPRIEYQVRTIRLDGISEAQGAHFAKLDVQGAELHVLRGMDRLLTDLKVLMMEYWPCGMAGMLRGHIEDKLGTDKDIQSVTSELWNLLKDFSVYQDWEDGLRLVQSVQDLRASVKTGTDHFVGLVCVRPGSIEEKALQSLIVSKVVVVSSPFVETTPIKRDSEQAPIGTRHSQQWWSNARSLGGIVKWRR